MRKPIAALLWKEMAEVSRFAIPGLFLYSILFYFSVRPVEFLANSSDPNAHFSWYMMLTAFVAGTIGFFQSNGESRGDLWGFLVHRPVTGYALFRAKVLVGIGGLLLCAGLPYVVAMWWLAVPGHRAAPFDRHLWLPGVADFLIGIVFYAAGMLTGARRSRWVTRPVGFIVAILAITIANALPFWAVPIFTGVTAVVLLTAAAAAFASGSDYESQPVWGRAAQIAVALPAIGVLWGLAAILVMAFTPESSPPPSATPRAQPPMAVITGSGTIALVRITDSPDDTSGLKRNVSVTDLHGRRLPYYEDSLGRDSIQKNVMIASYLSADTTFMWSASGAASYRNTVYWATPLFRFADQPLWYFERRSGLISVYDERSRRLSGWLGPDGYSAWPTRPATRFSGSLRKFDPSGRGGIGLLVLTSGVYQTRGTARPELIFTAPAGESVIDASTSGYASRRAPPAGGWGFFTAVTTTKRTYVLDQTTHRTQIVVDNDSGRGRGALLNVYRVSEVAGAPTFVWFRPRRWYAGDTLNHVLEFREPGGAPVAESAFAAEEYQDDLAGFGAGGGTAIRYVASSPVQGGFVGFDGAIGVTESFSYVEVGHSSDERPSTRAIVITVIANLCALCVIVWFGRRYAFSRQRMIIWSVLGLVTGPIALLAMWLLMQWPAREPCPSCGKPRVVTRDTCEHCGAPFPSPPQNGTEVFAPA